jgi:hypothetical protein
MLGVTGVFAAIKDGEFQVTEITPGTPAAGKLEMGDVLLAVNGESLQIQDPRHPLGLAINAAEGRDGKMTFDIKRGGATRPVTIQLEAIGSYGATYPIDCPKSQRMVDETAAFILRNGGPGEGINGNLEALFLLSTGKPDYLPALGRYASDLASKPAGSSVWHLGFSGIFLGEYYLATGDKHVLTALKERCDRLSEGQYYGGWSHGVTKCNPGYVTGGLVHAAGAQAFTTLVLARECGVEVNEKSYDDALRLFFRYAGRGGVPTATTIPSCGGPRTARTAARPRRWRCFPTRSSRAARSCWHSPRPIPTGAARAVTGPVSATRRSATSSMP